MDFNINNFKMAISTKTKRLVLAKSGGFCQNPECNIDLYSYYKSGKISNIEELAHIVGQKKEGPRGGEELELSERDEYDNIILLCPTCHTKIDKNPDIYKLETVLNWKQTHEEKIKSVFKAPSYKTREELRPIFNKILIESRTVFQQYGPQSEIALTSPQSEASTMWRAKCIEIIIPNNRKIIQLLESNYSLLTENELEIFAKFKIHKDGFEFNKLSGDANSAVPLFPIELNHILN
jgi:hypothetical protein